MFESVVTTAKFLVARLGFAMVHGAEVHGATVALKIAARVFTVEGGSTYVTGRLRDFTASN